MNEKLGRLISEDSRDQAYPMQAVLEVVPPTVTYRYWWTGGAWLDQGATGTCVGHAWAHWIEDGPITHVGTIDPFDIYREACQRDVWPENDSGDLNFGTSVRAAAKYLLEITRITEYRWAWDFDTVAQALLNTGPVVIGSWWYESMFRPDEDAVVTIDGSRVGGHAYLLNGINTKKEVVRLKNSWGRNWGKGGHAYLSFEDIERLIREQGEACLAVEVVTS